jgi:hypothetical protein
VRENPCDERHRASTVIQRSVSHSRRRARLTSTKRSDLLAPAVLRLTSDLISTGSYVVYLGFVGFLVLFAFFATFAFSIV